MWQQIFLCFLGLCAGTIVSAGLVGLIIGLSIIPRYAGITHTGDKILLYEDITMLGVVGGNAFYLFQWKLPLGVPGLIVFGISAGIFLGSWILALAEMADVFPILSRRLQFTKGISAVIITIALAKALGSLFFFYHGWQ